ncbi:MAG: heparinase II/III family protein [Rhizomicrobium sp.]
MPGRGQSYFSLVGELTGALWGRTVAPLRVPWRRSWFYRLQLHGRMPARIGIHPQDFSPRRLEDADALLKGRFRFNGEAIEVKDGSIFDKRPPSRAWRDALLGFAWLTPLSAAGGEPARILATNLISQWLKRNTRYSEPAWRPDVLGRRLINLFAHGRFVFTKSELLWRSRLLVSLREQSRMLARISKEAPDGLPRLEAAAAHALSGICLDDSPKRLASGLERLEQEIARQILPDGGHISRSPEALLCAYQLMAIVTDAMDLARRPLPTSLRGARDRMAPMVRFFRLGDGALAMFNGGREGDAKSIAALLARDEVRGQPFAYAPHSGYQRLTAGRTLLVMDCGVPPPGVFASTAHAGCLSFEFSTGNQRVVVNCGASPNNARWRDALRATAAHSTITIADRSMAGIMNGRFAKLLGPRLLGGPESITTNRQETAGGWSMDSAHDGYMRAFGVVHERRLTLSPTGKLLSGEDRLLPKGPRGSREAIPFAARFHIHPDIRVSPSQGGGAILKLASGEGWRFQASGGELQIEKSIYVAADAVRNCEQLVVSGLLRNEPAELGWVFERMAAA